MIVSLHFKVFGENPHPTDGIYLPLLDRIVLPCIWMGNTPDLASRNWKKIEEEFQRIYSCNWILVGVGGKDIWLSINSKGERKIWTIECV